MAVVYLAFVSLGLPDSLLGSGWPVMQVALNAPRGAAGLIAALITCSTIISSLLSDRLTRWLGVGRVTLISVALTAVALLGFSWSPAFWLLCLWAIPYGLGAGSVDAALNNFAATHYSSRAMNWLHCCWGVGAAISPFIMSTALTHQLGWTGGYRIVGGLQLMVVLVLVLTLSLWPQSEASVATADNQPLGLKAVWHLRGVKPMMLAFAAYCGVESLTGLWAATYLHLVRGIAPAQAAMFASLFYLGITGGRFLAGLIADRCGDRALVLGGGFLVLGGVAIMLWPGTNPLALGGLILLGIGCAPIYPAIIHSTPAYFGALASQAVIGVQMATYAGSAVIPPLFGLAITWVSVAWLPWLLLGLMVIMLVSFERLARRVGS